MMKNLVAGLGGLFLVAACGGTTTTVGGDGGTEDSGKACAASSPKCLCGAATCVDGTWSCGSCPGNPVDSGPGGDAALPEDIHATDYSQTCTAKSDCVVVADGPICGCRGCGSTAINAVDLARFNAELNARMMHCPSENPVVCAQDCILSEVTCTGGRCGVCHSPGCSATADAGADAH